MAKLPGKDAVLAELKRQDIELQGLVEHDAVITAEEMVDRAKSLPGGKAKNLFLKDKKGRMLLVSALHDTPTSTKLLESLKGDRIAHMDASHPAALQRRANCCKVGRLDSPHATHRIEESAFGIGRPADGEAGCGEGSSITTGSGQ
eukprot:SAG31_NODE_1532_length_7990_cov_8.692941_4_plen_146_part_00